MAKVFVTGFFNRLNLGDDLFVQVYKNVFQNSKYIVKYITTDDLKDTVETCDVLIVAGGDVLNNYFTRPIKRYILKSNHKGPVYCFNAGISHLSYLLSGELDNVYDHISFRSKSDWNVAKKMGVAKSVSWHPDIVFTLPIHKIRNPQKVVGICIANPVLQQCPSAMDTIVDLCKSLIAKNYTIKLLPFNTNSRNVQECDIISQDKIEALVASKNLVNVKQSLTLDDMLYELTGCSVVIAMRFHAHVLCILTRTPMVSFSKSRKVRALMYDVFGNQQYPFFEDIIDTSVVLNAMNSRSEFEMHCNKYLQQVTQTSFSALVCKCMDNMMPEQPDFFSSLANHLLQSLDAPHTDTWRLLKEPGYLAKQFPHKVHHSAFLASLTLHHLLDQPFEKYHYGLSQKLFSPDLILEKDLQWVLCDYYTNHFEFEEPSNDSSNVKILNQSKDLQVKHRFGWPFVTNHIINTFHNHKANISVDTYADKTFMWGSELYHHLGMIPYKEPWFGFIHHTFHTEKSPSHHLEQLLENPHFISSLGTCKGLIVLSKYLKTQLEQRVAGIPIYSIKHPTELNVVKWTMKQFLENQERKLVNIGAWLRDPFSIYLLTVPKNGSDHFVRCALQKAALRGHDMNSYFPDDTTNVAPGSVFNVCVNAFLKECKQTVACIPHLSNNEYDVLLTENIVFLNLVDASACNVVLECIARHTPLLVNKHPAVVEYLGESYPFYYTDMLDASLKCNRIDLIQETHDYIKSMYKNDLTIQFFTRQLQQILVKT